MPLWFLGVLILFSISIFWINKKRNAWDVLFFNSTPAILGLFMVGILAQDSDVWKIIASGLIIIATGGNIVGFFIESKKDNKKHD